MKASKNLIAMFTAGVPDYDGIAKVIEVSHLTAKRICQGESFNYGTAQKIATAFHYCSARDLFRRPFRRFNVWKNLVTAEQAGGVMGLSTEAKKRIGRKLWKITNPQRVRKQHKQYLLRKKRQLRSNILTSPAKGIQPTNVLGDKGNKCMAPLEGEIPWVDAA